MPRPPSKRRKKWLLLAATVCGTCYYVAPECFVVLARLLFNPLGTH